MNTYIDPVSKLLKLGRPPEGEWMDYPALGLTSEHIPALIQLMEDNDLRDMEPPEDLPDDEDLPEWYARIHAWRALAQLQAGQAILPILDMFHEIEDEDNDWLSSDSSEIFSLIGVAAISWLSEYLQNEKNNVYARVDAASALAALAKKYPEARDECISFLVSVLEKHKDNEESLNGFLIYELALLKAVEHIDLIEAAFASKKVDEFIMGDFEDVQIEMGLRETRSKPRKKMSLFDDVAEGIYVPQIKSNEQKKKDKDKRKQEKKSRKKNRKKK